MQARLLVARPPGHPLRAGSLALLAGLLHRWTGDPARGLQEVMAGAEAYAEWGVTRVHKLYLARLQRVTAECALDLAEGSSPRLTGFGRDAYLGIARPAIEQALVIAKETSDLSGEGMALLVQAREERLRGAADGSPHHHPLGARLRRTAGGSSARDPGPYRSWPGAGGARRA